MVTSGTFGALAFSGVLSLTGLQAATSLIIAGAVTGAAAAQRDIVFQTGDAANPQVLATRLTIGSNAATATVTWANVNHLLGSGTLGWGGTALSFSATGNVTLARTGNETGSIKIYGAGTGAGRGTVLTIQGVNSGNGDFIVATPNNLGDTDVTRFTVGGTAAVTTTTFAATNVLISAPATGIALAVRGEIKAGLAGTTQGTVTIDGVTSGTVTLAVAAAAGTYTMTLPPGANSNAGYQLTCAAADTITTWAAAASLREYKTVVGLGSPSNALDRLLHTEVYRFHFKPGVGTQDMETEYMGVMADEAPWAMHYKGGVLNPINTFGYTTLAIQALHAEIAVLQRQVAALQS